MLLTVKSSTINRIFWYVEREKRGIKKPVVYFILLAGHQQIRLSEAFFIPRSTGRYSID